MKKKAFTMFMAAIIMALCTGWSAAYAELATNVSSVAYLFVGLCLTATAIYTLLGYKYLMLKEV